MSPGAKTFRSHCISEWVQLSQGSAHESHQSGCPTECWGWQASLRSPRGLERPRCPPAALFGPLQASHLPPPPPNLLPLPAFPKGCVEEEVSRSGSDGGRGSNSGTAGGSSVAGGAEWEVLQRPQHATDAVRPLEPPFRGRQFHLVAECNTASSVCGLDWRATDQLAIQYSHRDRDAQGGGSENIPLLLAKHTCNCSVPTTAFKILHTEQK